ncbi:MAG TPA: FAD/NAD(P)-binding oxidoreductase [Acidobacteriaceae bacterium]|nr:FAD/NAD(P)-binding oxidoreductase [Acidobacteriaceae bacterium]
MIRTEVLVIGAGPAGIAAATAAAANGRKVIVLDDNLAAGGQIWRERTVKNTDRDRSGNAKQQALESLSRSGAQVYAGWSVFDAHASGTVEAIGRSGHDEIVEEFRFDRLVLATGARERFLPFPGWTRPGVFGAGGLQALVQGGYSVARKRVIVAGTGPLLMAVAAHLAEQGARIGAVVEQAPFAKLARFAASLLADPAKLMQGARYRARLWNARYRTGCWVVEAISGKQTQQLQAVRISNGERTWTEPCDLLACGYNLVPNTELASLLGCAFHGSFVWVDKAQRTSLPNVFCAGEPTGIGGIEAALVQGKIAGLTCAGKSTESLQRQAAAARAFGERLESTFALRDDLRSLVQADTIVCRCEDVPFGSLQGRTGWTDAKLQTRCGMGPCQGRVCGPAVEYLLGWKPVSVRPPLFPVPFEALCYQSGAQETEMHQVKIEEKA